VVVRKSANKKLAKAIGARVKELREAAGLTQMDLAGRCEKDIRQIRRIETGEVSATVDTILTICNGLDIELHEFFTFKFPTSKG
jgi:transcriptional regulator with XRE-family HTH domain